VRKRRQVKKNILVVLTTKVAEATLDSGGSGKLRLIGPALLIDSGGSSKNRLGGGDSASLGEGEGTASSADGETARRRNRGLLIGIVSLAL
jgi:hypothetical protein